MDQSEWIRIAIAMGLMIVGFILIPLFFLEKDRRGDERDALLSATHDETGVSR
jgi:hypothetical protein